MIINFFIQPEITAFSTQTGREGHVMGYVYSAKAVEYNIKLNEFKTQENTATFTYDKELHEKLKSCNKMWIPELDSMGFWILNIEYRVKDKVIEITFAEPNHPMNSILSASIFSWKIPQDFFLSTVFNMPKKTTFNQKDWPNYFKSEEPITFLKKIFDFQYELLPKLRYDLRFYGSAYHSRDSVYSALYENWTDEIPDNFGGYDFQELLTFFKKKFYLHGSFEFQFIADVVSLGNEHFGKTKEGYSILPGTLRINYELTPYELSVEDVFDMGSDFTLVNETIAYPSLDEGVALLNLPFERNIPYFQAGTELYKGNSYIENDISSVVVTDSNNHNKSVSMNEIMRKHTYHNITGREDPYTTIVASKHNNFWTENVTSKKFEKTTDRNFEFRNPSMKTNFIPLNIEDLNWESYKISPEQWLDVMVNKSNIIWEVESDNLNIQHIGKFILVSGWRNKDLIIRPITEIKLNEKTMRFTLGTNNDIILNTTLPAPFQSDLKQSA